MKKQIKKPNWLRKAKEGVQYLFCWSDENTIYTTKYENNERTTYEIKNGICSCKGYKIQRNCCHIKILQDNPDGSYPNTLQRVEIISYVMNTYASISKKVDVNYKKLDGPPVLRFTLTVSDIPKCRLVFWWSEVPVLIDFVPLGVLSEAS